MLMMNRVFDEERWCLLQNVWACCFGDCWFEQHLLVGQILFCWRMLGFDGDFWHLVKNDGV